MRLLRLQTRHPTGHVEQLTIETDRLLIGSGAHCDIRLPIAEARVEHVLLETGVAGLFARALDFEPPPTINNVPFTVAPLPHGGTIGIGTTEIAVELVEGGAAGADVVQHKKRSSPLSLIAFMIILPMSGYLLFGPDDTLPEPARPNPPELWKAPAAQCPIAGDARQTLSFAREKMTVADSKRERRPFHVQDGVAAVPTYELAAACFRAGGDAASSNLADDSAKYLRREMTDDFRMRRVRLEHALGTEDYVSAQKEVRVLLQFVEHNPDREYVTWLSNLERKLKLKIGEASTAP